MIFNAKGMQKIVNYPYKGKSNKINNMIGNVRNG